jgi:hypothetical protein
MLSRIVQVTLNGGPVLWISHAQGLILMADPTPPDDGWISLPALLKVLNDAESWELERRWFWVQLMSGMDPEDPEDSQRSNLTRSEHP